jgi:hypothetical protein
MSHSEIAEEKQNVCVKHDAQSSQMKEDEVQPSKFY